MSLKLIFFWDVSFGSKDIQSDYFYNECICAYLPLASTMLIRTFMIQSHNYLMKKKQRGKKLRNRIRDVIK